MKQFESYVLDTSNACLWRGGVQISLPPKPFEVLRYLVENPGRLVTHDELLDALWPETYVQPQVLRTYVLELRKVLGDEADRPRFIQTQPKRGYRFVAPVTEGSATVHPAPALAAASVAKSAGIVGRDAELTRLRSAFHDLAAGERRVLFITGETGIGKTALLDAFCRASSGTASFARGQCVQGVQSKERYYPVMEALGQLCASPDGDAACRTLARFAPAWLSRLDRETEIVAKNAEPQSSYGRMAGDLCRALEELSGVKPLILVLEDLHLADDATLDLVSALARRRAPAKLMVVATYVPRKVAPERTVECPVEWLKRDLLVHQCCTEITLGALPQAAVAELIARELHQQNLPAGLAEFVQIHSEGNPLFALAMLDHLIAQGSLVREGRNGEAQWEERVPFAETDSVVPHGLFEMIELEIARLPGDEQSILEAGSLMPVAFPAWAAAAALEKDVAEIEETCNALARRLHFVVRAGEDELPDGTRSTFYVFTHGLYREVLYQRQSVSRRARRHTRIAERLGKLFAGREADVAREMAMHYEAAGNWKCAAEVLRIAARSARRRGAHYQVEEILERALGMAQNLSAAERDAEAEAIRVELASARTDSPAQAGKHEKMRQEKT